MRLLLMEDDEILSSLVKKFLCDAGYLVDNVYDGEEAQEYIFSKKYDLLILDINVPFVDGLSILKKIREFNIKTPVIFLTSLTDLAYMESAFSLGCDDFIKKPFKLKELELRINYIKKTFNIDFSSIVKIDNFIGLDLLNYKIIKEKKEYQIAKKEASILNYFINNKNKIISTDELILNIWEYDCTPSLATIRTYIKNLRKIIGIDYFTTIKGSGYRFNLKI